MRPGPPCLGRADRFSISDLVEGEGKSLDVYEIKAPDWFTPKESFHIDGTIAHHVEGRSRADTNWRRNCPGK